MGALCVVIRAAGGLRDACMMQIWEQGFVQQLVPETDIEASDESDLGRLPGCDVMPVDLAFIGKGQGRVRSELGPVTL